jgi:MoxR-like ATPase
MDDKELADVHELGEKIQTNIQKVIVGKQNVIQSVIICLLAQGHLLIEDVPGVGKTILARSLARTINCQFNRIQFTPDMLPSDIVGVSIYNQKNKSFEYRPGPVVTQVLLADEINRASPKTQSALLEAMEERQVTVDGQTRLLQDPFIVMATQNPIEYEGTFPLPEAQLDRFMMKISLGYPSELDEIKVFELQQLEHPIMSLKPVCEVDELVHAQTIIKKVFIAESIKKYIVSITRATRSQEDVYLGASPRGSLYLFKTAQARAALLGRDYVLPDDVKALATPVLCHRLVLNPSGRIKNISPESIVEDVLASIQVPTVTDEIHPH